MISHGQTGLNVAFDLPTQMGYDSDDPMAEGEVGRVGMAVDSLRDFEIAFKDIDLEKIGRAYDQRHCVDYAGHVPGCGGKIWLWPGGDIRHAAE